MASQDYHNAKRIIVFAVEAAVVFLMGLGLISREASLFLAALMAFYFIFSPLRDGIWLFIASIPLFVALPISKGFDTLASWRIFSLILLLVLFYRRRLLSYYFSYWKEIIKEHYQRRSFECLSIIFLAFAFFSLLVAEDLLAGIKKIIFLLNAFFIYFIIKKAGEKDRSVLREVLSGAKTAIAFVLGVGLAQFITVFIVPLSVFWNFWDSNFIPVFYGEKLGWLLSYSNTWFSYYPYLPATLRMFSVFPDSHSFALFCVLSLPFLLWFIFRKKRGGRKKVFFLYLTLLFCLSAIIFSGSRGVWVGGIGSFFALLLLLFANWSPALKKATSFFIPLKKRAWRRQMMAMAGVIIIFFLLFPVASRVLLLSQQVQMESELDLGKASLFRRARSIFQLDEASIKGRLEIWQRTADSIAMRPLLGVGIGNYPIVLKEGISSAERGASAHSLYLDIAAEMGIFSLLIMLALFWQIFKDAWEKFTRSHRSFFRIWTGFFVLALIWLLGYSVFDVVLLNDKVLLFFAASLSILYFPKR